MPDFVPTARPSAEPAAAPAPGAAGFQWPVRVYYEDTDAAGIVYYANYLRYFERCRTEWLRALGVDQVRLAAEQARQFVVAEMSVAYRSPARLDDQLTITARITELARSYLVFDQAALRGEDLIATAQVKVACIDTARGQPCRLPAAVTSQFESAR